MNWESIIKSTAVLTAVALVAFLGFSIYQIFFVIPGSFANVQLEAPASLEANADLKATLDTLEAVWAERQQFRFRLKQDPLFLGRVIKDYKYDIYGSREAAEESEIRLTATVVDENPKAIIKYNGKSFVVQAGDFIGKVYKVIKIEKKQVVLHRNGKKMILTNKPVSNFNEKDRSSEFSNNTEFYDNH